MIRSGLLVVLVGSMEFGLLAGAVPAGDSKKADDTSVIKIERGGGLAAPEDLLAHYWFSMAPDGSWVFSFGNSTVSVKGKLSTDALESWLREFEAGGLYKVKSNPRLGAADDPFMDITVRVKGKKTQVRIPYQEKLSQAVQNKIYELAIIALAKPGKK